MVLPHLFGTLNDDGTLIGGVTLVARLCVRSEFTKLALHVTSPIAGWLRALARSLHSELGGSVSERSGCVSPAGSRWR